MKKILLLLICLSGFAAEAKLNAGLIQEFKALIDQGSLGYEDDVDAVFCSSYYDGVYCTVTRVAEGSLFCEKSYEYRGGKEVYRSSPEVCYTIAVKTDAADLFADFKYQIRSSLQNVVSMECDTYYDGLYCSVYYENVDSAFCEREYEFRGELNLLEEKCEAAY